jgi:ketosteroid isomerase-like protein
VSDERERAVEPQDLERLFVRRVNAGDVEGLVALFEPNAVMVHEQGQVATGHDEIRRVLDDFVRSGVELTLGDQRAPVRAGDLVLTSTRLHDGGVTAEVARRRPDGTWRWVIDRWNVLGE